MAPARERNWTIRPAAPEDGPAISAVLTAAGTASWSEFLDAERVERATRGAEQPADLVAIDERGVFAFVAWDAATGEITRASTPILAVGDSGRARRCSNGPSRP